MNFEEYVEEIKKIEKKAVKHEPYGEEVVIANLVDLSPDEYVELGYEDLMHLYERMQKVAKASTMLKKAAGMAEAPGKKPIAPPPQVSKEKEAAAKEVEESIKKMTQETIEATEKIKAARLAPEKEERPPAAPAYGEIEFEREFEREKIEMEKETAKPPARERPRIEIPEIDISREIEIEKEEAGKKEEKIVERAPEEEAKAEKPGEPVIKEEKKPVAEEVKIVFPSALESPDKAAEDKYKEIEKEVMTTIGEGADEAEIKKKMLELTKELFKEKSTGRREHIKLEITVLKNILAQKREAPLRRGAAKKAKKAKPDETLAHAQLFETIVSTQRVELAQTKDSIITNYKNQIAPIKTKFERAVAEAKTNEEKKDAYDSFVFQLSSILEHTPTIITKYSEYLKRKHLAELSNMENSLAPNEAEIRKKLEERKAEVKNYDKEFGVAADIIKKEIETLIRRGGHEVFKKAEEEKTAEDIEEEKLDEILSDIQPAFKSRSSFSRKGPSCKRERFERRSNKKIF